MRVGPVQARVLKWVCRTGERFVISDVNNRMDLSYDSADSAIRKLVDKGFVAHARPPKLGSPNLYEVTEKGRLWQAVFSEQTR